MFVKGIRKVSLLTADMLIINLAFLFALLLHYEGAIPRDALMTYFQGSVIITIGKLLIFKFFQLYGSLWEYASIEELVKVVMAVIVANFLGFIYMLSIGMDIYLGVYLVAVTFEILAIGGVRFGYRFARRLKNHKPLTRQAYSKHVLVIGSGATASLIANEIKNHPDTYGQVVGFVDDDERKFGKMISGVKVLGNRYDIYSLSKRHHIEEIIVAMPTATPSDMKEILVECKRSDAKVRILPGVREIIDGQVSMKRIRDVEIEDLLGRDPVNLNVTEIASYIEDKVVMVTGGGGSIGSELCRQIARFDPKKLIILDIYENNAYEIQNELLREYGKKINLDVIIASVRDRDNIFSIMEEERPHVIFHAAAHKHVPLMERSPAEAIKNNVFGTMNVAEAADAYGVERFVMISTDKAVNPTNIMGASKRMCEMVIQGLAAQSKTNFTAVRFGNVLGSNGSVIPLFKKQIKEGGPVTVTHKEIIRYFMTIPEAAQLVIQSGAIAKGGEIFVLDMGEPVKIYDLAVDLIRLSGFKPHEEIKIEVTGLRPGEKLYEELLMEDEGLENTKYSKIHIGQLADIEYGVFKKALKQLDPILKARDCEALIEMVQLIVPTFRDSQLVNSENKHKIENIAKYKVSKVEYGSMV